MTPTQLLKKQLDTKDALIAELQARILKLTADCGAQVAEREQRVVSAIAERDAARAVALSSREARSQLLILKATMKSACDRIGSLCGVEQ